MRKLIFLVLYFWIPIAALALAWETGAAATELRVVSYNIDDADQGNDNNITASYAGLPTVLQAIGQHHIGTNAQPIDVLGVEELNSTTLSNLVTSLNNIYGSGSYAFDPTTDPTNGGGTDGLIYNTHTVQVVSATAIGPVNTSGAARAPMRYQLRPIGYGSNADFYMYVSHYKSSSGTSNLNRRNVEATEIRQDADALGSSAHIIYSGDFNLTSGSSEPAWTTLTAAGNGQAHDPTGATGWTNNTSNLNYLYSESSSSLTARFDFQLVSGAMLNQPGLQLAADTSDPLTGNFPSSKYPYAYEVFGNNGTTPVNGLTNAAGNTSLSDLANSSTVLNDLMEPYSGNSNHFVGSDHLPVVADYILTGVSPLGIVWSGGGGTNNWSTSTNWSAAPSNGASLTFAGTTRLSNTNDSLTSVGSITFDNTAGAFAVSGNALTIAGGITNNSIALQTINLNLTLGAAQQFNAASGNLLVNGTIANGGNLLSVVGSSNTTLAGNISGAGGVTKSGAGTLALSANNSYSGATTVTAGILTVGHPNAVGTGGLTINGSAKVILNSGLSQAVALPNLSINGGSSIPTAALDIKNNKLVLNNASPAAATATHTTVTAQVENAFDNFAWDKGGLTSSTVQNDVNNTGLMTAVGIMLNNDGTGGNFFQGLNGTATFGGQATNANSVLVRYTYLSDLDLDGVISSQDYTLFSAGYLGGAPAIDWTWGDLNYDGTIDSQDYTDFSTGYLANIGQPAITSSGEVQPVPEPSTLVLATIGLVAITMSRYRFSSRTIPYR